MAIIELSPPTIEPVSLDEVKLHCRIEDDIEDTLIMGKITAAREWCEQFTRRALVRKTLTLVLDSWPVIRELELPQPPLVAVTAIQCITAAAETITLNTANFDVDNIGAPGRISPIGGGWPSEKLKQIGGVQITYTAGWEPNQVPQAIRESILMLVSHLIENRGVVSTGNTIPREMPFSVKMLLRPWRLWG